MAGQAAGELAGYSAFTGLGVLGAIFANATGAGGGVIFIPAFAQLGFTEAQAVATSFGIQCFGMTAGALAWSSFYRSEQRPGGQWAAFLPTVALCAAASIAGLWSVFAADIAAPAALGPLFAAFSLFLGIAILVTVLLRQSGPLRTTLSPLDWVALPLIAYSGGIVTAWLSVGVGEFVAFYLIVRRYEVTLAVAAAVVISAISVWSAAPEQLLVSQQANWQVVLFAGPGAVVGGLLARHLVLKLGARRLKLFFAFWLLIIGLVEWMPLA
ncbi:sulfite exporter TauE/SafE family protein [Seongchinamella unica]|uniref:Probable membrane transporter protein n=2 Tax=Seongchinamella unica TaxID=2547392 RepID=A0A4R5LXJ5_9GAMM|nr:sulfite exporter TauE/SafE family protein [Seongchinamella unica]